MNKKEPMPFGVFNAIMRVPVTKPALKEGALRAALYNYTLSEWQQEEFREQWEFTSPKVSCPLDRI